MAEEKKGLFSALGNKMKEQAKTEANEAAKTAADALKTALHGSTTGTAKPTTTTTAAKPTTTTAKPTTTTTAKPTTTAAKPTTTTTAAKPTAATTAAKPTATATVKPTATTTAAKPTATTTAAKPTATATAAKPTATTTTAAAKTNFKDVPADAYYAEAVAWAVSKGITSGTGDDTFSPDNPCHRGHAATFLWRAQGSPEPKTKVSPFTDVTDGPFFKAILWATENGIIDPKDEKTYAPKEQCTRGQVLTYILRTQGKPKANEAEACTWAAGKRLLAGQSGSAAVPCTRADIVTYLYRALK